MSNNNIRYNYVYLITNKINNKNYVGQHHGFLNDSYMGSGRLILKAIEKYGKKNFSKEILAICNSQKELDILETVYIDLYKSIGKAEYNLSKGGEGDEKLWQTHSIMHHQSCLKREELLEALRKSDKHLSRFDISFSYKPFNGDRLGKFYPDPLELNDCPYFKEDGITYDEYIKKYKELV